MAWPLIPPLLQVAASDDLDVVGPLGERRDRDGTADETGRELELPHQRHAPGADTVENRKGERNARRDHDGIGRIEEGLRMAAEDGLDSLRHSQGRRGRQVRQVRMIAGIVENYPRAQRSQPAGRRETAPRRAHDDDRAPLPQGAIGGKRRELRKGGARHPSTPWNRPNATACAGVVGADATRSFGRAAAARTKP
ncbi:MAG: hypothetical protein HYR98_08155 [Nitrospirae bacterium]|nr:hypothetical protein [Nitrospirota bacterium]